MALRGDYRGRLEHPDAYGKRTGDCGDTIEFFMNISNGRIRDLVFDVHGCVHTNACANTVVDLAGDKSLEDAWKIGPDDVEEYLETLPADHRPLRGAGGGGALPCVGQLPGNKAQSLEKDVWQQIVRGLFFVLWLT